MVDSSSIDFSGTLDLDPSLGSVSGRVALIEAVIRRLTTITGALPDFPDYGYDITALIGTAFNAADIESAVQNQILLEEEIDDVEVTATLLSDNVTIQLDITLYDGTGPFDLTVTVDDLKVDYIIGQQ